MFGVVSENIDIRGLGPPRECLRSSVLRYWRNYAASRNLPGSKKSGDLALIGRHVEGVPHQSSSNGGCVVLNAWQIILRAR